MRETTIIISASKAEDTDWEIFDEQKGKFSCEIAQLSVPCAVSGFL